MLPKATMLLLSDGDQVIPAFQKLNQRPDLILMGLQMPRPNGLETLESLRRYPGLGEVPIVILIDTETKTIREQLLRAGADEVVSKPNAFDQLLQLVVHWIITWL
ncbi:hypothetical protein GCM10028809_08390 [Spirosoma gilvum]